jgi:regulator of PEP synthase PpsR (kinase-PPPase family)
MPFVDTLERVLEVVNALNEIANKERKRPVVFTTMINAEFRRQLQSANAIVLDFFEPFIGTLEGALGVSSAQRIGGSHGLVNQPDYQRRIDALNFTLNTDDGLHTRQYAGADVVLMGVSRSGKTPTCLYLALQYGVQASNYPLTEEDLVQPSLPTPLQPHQPKLYGLTIDPYRLHQIRSGRRPNSHYASIENCQDETRRAETLFRRNQIPYVNTSTVSIEEIAARILQKAGLKRYSL